jgi:hypothetical protein
VKVEVKNESRAKDLVKNLDELNMTYISSWLLLPDPSDATTHIVNT